MAELFKFRCPECAKLLGVSPRKVGREIACPRCGAELIVPSPDDQPPDDLEPHESSEILDLGIDLGFASPLDIRPADRAPAPPIESPPEALEAIAFLEHAIPTDPIADDPIAQLDNLAARDPEPDPTADEPDPDPIVATPPEPLLPRAPRTRATAATIDRRRDVVLPRTAATAWALFALFALAASFVAGLMIGHYRWK